MAFPSTMASPKCYVSKKSRTPSWKNSTNSDTNSSRRSMNSWYASKFRVLFCLIFLMLGRERPLARNPPWRALGCAGFTRFFFFIFSVASFFLHPSFALVDPWPSTALRHDSGGQLPSLRGKRCISSLSFLYFSFSCSLLSLVFSFVQCSAQV